jgi:hypothetical protein
MWFHTGLVFFAFVVGVLLATDASLAVMVNSPEITWVQMVLVFAVFSIGLIPAFLVERLLLDGQQRLTSLFQALASGQPVQTLDARGKKLSRWYYIDMNAALVDPGDRDEAVISVPADRQIRDDFGRVVVKDYSTTPFECAGEMFPLSRVFDSAATNEWMVAYLQLDSEHMPARLTRWNLFQQRVLANFTSYLVPVIVLTKDTPREAVCSVFEKVNTGGVALNVFELLTAMFASYKFNLKEDWRARKTKLQERRVLTSLESSDYLQAISLLATRKRKLAWTGVDSERPGVSCKRRDILRLKVAEYTEWADAATEAFEWAATFLAEERIFIASDLPYRSQLVPLAAIRVAIGAGIDNHGTLARIRQWYWCGVFGELYGSATETRFALDLPDVLTWLEGGPEPSTIADANFAPARLLTLRTRNSAAYKGLYALLLRDGGYDFRTGEPVDVQMYFDERIDIHHIFPQDWCKTHYVDPKRCDSIVNKTPLAAKTNRILSGNPPSLYLSRIQKTAGIDDTRMASILRSHVIEPDSLRTDNFETFFQTRETALLARIEQVMGKPIARGVPVPIVDEMPQDYQEDEEDGA